MKRLLPFLLLLLAASCEKEVALKIPEQPSKLTLYCVAGTGDTLRVAVGRSRSITEKRDDSMQTVPDATVVIFADGFAPDTARFDAITRRYLSRTVAQPGRHYRITVARSGFETATAEADAPAVVPITALDYFPEARASSNGGTQDEIRVRWTDPAAAGDLYMVDVFGSVPDWNAPFDPNTGPTVFTYGSLGLCVQTTDVDAESVDGTDPGSLGVGATCAYLPSIFLRDASFNGREKEFRFFVDSGQMGGWGGSGSPSEVPRIRLAHVTPAYLAYQQSLSAFYATDGNPFAEPVNVKSAVQGGYGLFAIEGAFLQKIE